MCIVRLFCVLLLLAVIQIIFYVFYTFLLLDLARGLQIGSVNSTSLYCGIGSSGHVNIYDQGAQRAENMDVLCFVPQDAVFYNMLGL